MLEEYVTYAIQLCRHGACEKRDYFWIRKVGPWNLQKRTFWLAPRWKRGCQFYRGAHYRQRRCKLYRFQIYNFSWALWVTRARFRAMLRDCKKPLHPLSKVAMKIKKKKKLFSSGKVFISSENTCYFVHRLATS